MTSPAGELQAHSRSRKNNPRLGRVERRLQTASANLLDTMRLRFCFTMVVRERSFTRAAAGCVQTFGRRTDSLSRDHHDHTRQPSHGQVSANAIAPTHGTWCITLREARAYKTTAAEKTANT